MLRVLRIYWHFFSWQRAMLVVAAIGLVMLVTGVLLPAIPSARVLFGIIGAGFAFFFVTVFSPFGYRQIIGNRRFVLVPGFRRHASLALLLIAITGTAAIAFVARVVPQEIENDTLVRLVLLGFTCISAYVLVVQWLITYRTGLILFGLLMPIVVVRLAMLGRSMLEMDTGVVLMTAVVAGLAWVWLLVASRSPTLPRGILAPGFGGRQDVSVNPGSAGIQFGSRSIALGSPAGTLMRGTSDDWRVRLLLDLVFLLSFPIGMLILFRVMGYATREKMPEVLSPAFFMIWSIGGVCLMPSMIFGEWPATARKLWLRMAGDRDSVWRLMERSLLGDALLSALAASVVAWTVVRLSDVSLRAVVMYVAGIALGIPLSTYISFLIRASGWNRLVQVLIVVLLASLIAGLSIVSLASQGATGVAGVLAVVAVLALGFRALARRRMHRLDWCAVRPLRQRRPAI